MHNFTGLILCAKFLSLFNYTVFDYDRKTIELYSDTIPITVNNRIVNNIIYSNAIMSILNIILLIINN